MRYIDSARLVLPIGWEQQARDALEAIEGLDPEERAKAINRQSDIWKALKPVLEALSDHKCWYCESRNDRSDNAVDHFRPKNSVKGTERFPGADEHPGYWWLAFDYHNYRFSCTFCNSVRKAGDGSSGGKQDYFPLCNESDRARCADDDQDREYPVLLDPVSPTDVDALWFDDDGSAVCRPDRGNETDAELELRGTRVDESILLYHLNHPRTKERRYHLVRKVRERVAESDKWLRRAVKGEQGAKSHADEAMRRVREALRADAEFSSAAHCVLHGIKRRSRTAEILSAQR